jgi:hypothetical protein
MLKAMLAVAAMAVVTTAAEPLTLPSSSSSALPSRKRRRDDEPEPSTTTTTAAITNNKKKNKRNKKTAKETEIKSILDVCQVSYGLGSNGFSDTFRKKSKAEREAILDKFSPEAIGFKPKTEFSKDPYPCPKPFQDYRLIVNSGTDNYFVHKDRPNYTIRKPTNGNQVCLCIDEGSGEQIMVNFLKLALASLYPDLSMRQFGTPLFNETTGQSCGMINVDHIKEKAQHGGTDGLSNLQLMCLSHNSSKSHTENKERHVKKGKSKSYAFPLKLIKFLNGKRSGPFVELKTYQKFKSTHDTAAITTFAGGTVYQGNLRDMINGNQNKVGVKGREKGVFVQIHPDYVRDQEQERKDFDGKTLDRKFIDEALGTAFREKNSAHKLLFNADGEVYNNKGQITRGTIPNGDPFGLIRMLNSEYMHTLVFFAHNISDMSLEQKIAMKNDSDLMITHKESNPATYVMLECTPNKRHVDIHAKPMDPPLTYDEFMELPVTEQKSVRVMYSNRADTLRSATKQENNKESAESMAKLDNMHDLYRIHCYQRENFQ